MVMRLMRSPQQPPPPEFADESRIAAEGQKDGERNIPEMGSYTPAPFEQALIANGEQAVQQIYKATSAKIAKLRPVVESLQRHLNDLERRMRPVADAYKARSAELGRDAMIVFPPVFHWILIAFLAVGEFPLNTVVFRLFGEAEYMTYIMASTLALIIPLIGVLTPLVVAATLYAVSLLRNTYITSQMSSTGTQMILPEGNQMAYALFALNALVFFGATVASYFAHDPDERLDGFHHSMKALDRKMHPIRKKLYAFGTELNGEIEQAKSHIEETRSLTKQRIQLYRQSNIRHRRLLPPPSFRRDTEFPTLQWWPTVSMNNNHHPEGK